MTISPRDVRGMLHVYDGWWRKITEIPRVRLSVMHVAFCSLHFQSQVPPKRPSLGLFLVCSSSFCLSFDPATCFATPRHVVIFLSYCRTRWNITGFFNRCFESSQWLPRNSNGILKWFRFLLENREVRYNRSTSNKIIPIKMEESRGSSIHASIVLSSS